MNLYDILQNGYHTPLTAPEIAELFHAGRLDRNTPCKRVEKKEWRTVDESFPLLKYDSAASYRYEPIATTIPFADRRRLAMALCALLAAAAVVSYFALADRNPSFVSTASVHSRVLHPTVRVLAPTQNVTPAITYNTPSSSADPFVSNPPQNNVVTYYEPAVQQITHPSQARLTEERRLADEARLKQTEALRDRANNEQREVEKQKALGRNEHIPLDELHVVHDVGGVDVTVKIHDNDVTSFDVWINGARRRAVKKEKGITGSRTDETLIYSNGRAALYYVWEISGRLTHCLLRVRES